MAPLLKIGISQNANCDNLVGFIKSGHILEHLHTMVTLKSSHDYCVINVWVVVIVYSRIAQYFGGVNFWRIDCFMVLVGENVSEFTVAYSSYCSESGIWLGKILVNGVSFAKSAKFFPRQNFPLYSI